MDVKPVDPKDRAKAYESALDAPEVGVSVGVLDKTDQEPLVTPPQAQPFYKLKKRVGHTLIFVTILLVAVVASMFVYQRFRSMAPETTGQLKIEEQVINPKTNVEPIDSNQNSLPQSATLQVQGSLQVQGDVRIVGADGSVLILRSGGNGTGATRTLEIPASSNGSICINSNNCGYATSEQLNSGLARLDAKQASLVNDINGEVILQGTANQVSVNTAGGIITISGPQDLAQLSSPTFANLLLTGGLRIAALNCTTFDNDGKLTTNAAGQIICDDDDGTGGGGAITGGGTQYYIAKFTDVAGTNLGSSSIYDDGVFVGIGTNTPGYKLEVGGDINTTGVYRINGVPICAASGCTPASGSGNYIQNQSAATQAANFNIQGAAATVTAKIKGSDAASNILEIRDYNNVTRISVGATGLLSTLNGFNNSGSCGLTGAVAAKFCSGAASNISVAIGGSNGQTGDLLQFQNSSGTVLSTFNARGSLGIGTATPQSLLDVVGTGTALTGTGTVSVTTSSANVTGTGTSFMTQIQPGDSVIIGGVTKTVAGVSSDTQLVMEGTNYPANQTNVSFTYIKPVQRIRAAANQMGLTVQGGTGSAFAFSVLNDTGTASVLGVSSGGFVYGNGFFVNGGQTFGTSASSGNTGSVIFGSGASSTSGNTGNVNINSGNATSGNSGNIIIDSGTATGTTGTVSVGTANASSVNIGRAGVVTSVSGIANVGTTSTGNRITNPSFEANTTGWNAASGSNARVTGTAYSGTAADEFTTSAASNSGPAYNAGLPVIAGTTYTASAYVKASSIASTATMRVVIAWRDSGGATISQPASSTITIGNAWQRVTVTATAPAGAVNAVLTYYTVANTTGDRFFLDAAQFEEGSVVTPYIGTLRGSGDLTAANNLAVQGGITANGDALLASNLGVGTTNPQARLDVVGQAALTGTGTISSSGTTVTGVGTSFTTELRPGDTVIASGQVSIVQSITSNTSLTTTYTFSPALSAVAFTYARPATRISASTQQTALQLQASAAQGISPIMQYTDSNGQEYLSLYRQTGGTNFTTFRGDGALAINASRTGGELRFNRDGGTVKIFTDVTSGTVSIGGFSATGTRLGIQTDNTATTGQFIRGAAGQTANLFELQDSTGAVMTRFSATGRLGINANASSAQLAVIADAAGTIGQIIQGAGSQTGDLLQFKNAGGTVLSDISSAGAFKFGGNNALAGGFAADLQIYGADTPGLNVRAYASQTTDLIQLQNSSNILLSGFNASGQLFVTDASGNGFRATLATEPLGGNATITIPNTGGVNDTVCLFSLGNCVTGGGGGGGSVTGTGTANYVARWTNSTNLGTGQLFDNGTNVGINNTAPGNRLSVNTPTTTVSTAQTLIATGGTNNIGFAVQGAASQTADLLQIQNSSGAVLTNFDASGYLNFNRAASASDVILSGRVAGDTNDRIEIRADGRINFGPGNAATDTNLVREGSGQLATSGTLRIHTWLSVASTAAPANTKLFVQSASSGTVSGVFRGASGQTADLLQLQNDAGTVLSGFNSKGYLSITNPAAASDAVISTRVAGDTQNRVQIAADGTIGWGNGSSTPGVTLTRDADNGVTLSGRLAVTTSTTGTRGIAVYGSVGQTADLFQLLNNSSPTVLSGFNAAGQFFQGNSGFNTTLSTVTLTANRNITLPNASGTVCLDSNNCQFLQNGGNSFGATMSIGTLDANGVQLLVNSSVALGFDATGNATFKPNVDGTTTFSIQNAGGTSLFSVDATNNRLHVGPAVGSTTGTLLVLGNKTTAGDPTGINGAMYYNDVSKRFRCYEDAEWKDCIDAVRAVRKTADQAFSGTSYADASDLSFPVLANRNYSLSCKLLLSTAAAGGGYLSMNGPASPSQFTATFGKVPDQSSGDSYATSATYDDPSTSSVFRIGTSSIGTDRFILDYNAIIANGANNGTWTLRSKAHTVAGSALTLYANSSCTMRALP